MADMDVYEQVAGFHAELEQQTGRRATKFTMASDVHDWFVQLASTVNAPDYEPASCTTLMGVPFAIDDEFWPGQLRIHRGEEFEDRYVILPIEYPRLEARGLGDTVERLHELALAERQARLVYGPPLPGHAFFTLAARDRWDPLGVRGLTIQTPDA